MNRKQAIGGLIGVALLLGLGYWWGQAASQRAGTRAAHPNDRSVNESRADTGKPARPRRILYYRNPMGLNDTSPLPRKDAMGMDYIAVYEGDVPDGPQVKIDLTRLQKLGVRTEIAATRNLSRTTRAVGTVQANERGLYTVSPKFAGWITTLFVNTSGAAVRRGQPLLAAYSPELVSAQEEYRVARATLQAMSQAPPEARAAMQSVADSSLQRLHNWDIADVDLKNLEAGQTAKRSLMLRSPADGVVTDMTARAGMRFMPGEPLFQIADLSTVWVIANIFEQDLGFIKKGQLATVSLTAFPGRQFTGEITFIYPTLQAATRTARVRIELPNAQGQLKPNLYGTVEIHTGERVAQVAIPESSVLDSGTRQVVLVDRGGGTFGVRVVTLGARGDGYVEVLRGLAEGESVVINGNFLIDAESNLKAALADLGEQTNSSPNVPASDAHAEH